MILFACDLRDAKGVFFVGARKSYERFGNRACGLMACH